MEVFAAPPSDGARSAPPLMRGAMTAAPWFGFWRGLLFALWPGARWPRGAVHEWHRVAQRRRRLLIVLVAALSGAGLWLRLGDGAAHHDAWWWAASALMTLLFAWVGVGCATACLGVWALWRGDAHALRPDAARTPIGAGVRTALVMPICNEDITEVFAGLRATCESLAASGAMPMFDVFVLSDTSDPALAAAEERAWARLRTMLGEGPQAAQTPPPPEGVESSGRATLTQEPQGEGGRLFYRRRRRRTKRKAGNVADFCRRWGRRYRYMVVLDADSTMSGETLVELVRLMEQHPRAGIIQTLPQIARPATLHARAQQFASSVCGRLFALGMAWWQLGDAHYWGHNAIIRVQPFMRHCGLARLPGRGALAGEILSHDFVEAALMGRAGYEVWLVPQLDGSWECCPSNLLDELQRDRRWCQGNLQNARLIAEPGWRAAHRVMFGVGALSYAVAPLWLAFIVLGLAGGATASSVAPLWLLTLALLVLPRVLGVAVVVAQGQVRAFGGVLRLIGSALLELLLSTLQAPLRMLAHSLYVLGALTGLRLEWKSPPRGAQALGWLDATRRIGSLVVLPLVFGFGLLRRAATVALAPMLLPLSLAVPFTVLTGHPRAGRLVARLGLLRTPQEARPPRPLVRAGEHAEFIDLVPVPAVRGVTPRRAPAWRLPAVRALSVSATAAVALLTVGTPSPGVAPELPPHWRVDFNLRPPAYWNDAQVLVVAQAQPPLRKRVLRDKPARKIDDALRQRAVEAVERALAAEAPA